MTASCESTSLLRFLDPSSVGGASQSSDNVRFSCSTTAARDLLLCSSTDCFRIFSSLRRYRSSDELPSVLLEFDGSSFDLRRSGTFFA